MNGKLDMHSDEMDVQAPNLIRMENVIVSAPGRYDRRPGIRAFDGQTYRDKGEQGYYANDSIGATGTTVSDSPPALYSYKSQVLSHHKHRVLSHDSAISNSVQTYQGFHFPHAIEQGPGSSFVADSTNVDIRYHYGIVRVGNYYVRPCLRSKTTYNEVCIDVWDVNTNEQVVNLFVVDRASTTNSTKTGTPALVIAPSETAVALAYPDETNFNTQINISFLPISSFATGAPTISSTVTVTNVFTASAGNWDLHGDQTTSAATPFSLAYMDLAPTLTVITYTSTGGAGATRSSGAAVIPYSMRLKYIAGSGYYVVYNIANASYIVGFNTSLSATLFAATAIVATFTATYDPSVLECALSEDTTSGSTYVRIWISGRSAASATSPHATISSCFNASSGAEISSSARYTVYNQIVSSRGFLIDGCPCVVLEDRNYVTTGGDAVGKKNSKIVLYEYETVATVSLQTNRYVPRVIAKYGLERSDRATYINYCYDVYVYNASGANYVGNTDGTGGYVQLCFTERFLTGYVYNYQFRHLFINLDNRNKSSYQCFENTDHLFLTGAAPSIYDGERIFEAGYHHTPHFQGAVLSAGAGLPASALNITYCYEWYDAKGRVHRSRPASPVTLTPSAGNLRVTLTLKTLTLTGKEVSGVPVRLCVYRTTASDAYTYYLAYEIDNNPWNNSVTVILADSDATISARRTLYTTGGALENDMWPSVSAICSYQNRVFVIDSESNRILYSKSYSQDEAAELSVFNELLINDLGGDIVQIKAKDQLLVAFKKTATYISSGQPANDLGQGANFSEWQPVSQSVGCKWPRATTQTTDGIWFVSDNGPQLFSQGQIANIGQPISPFAGYDFIAASNIETSNRSHVVFSVYSGTVAQTIASTGTARLLVYDRTHQTWAIWKNDVCSYISGICAPSGTDKLYYGIYIYNNYPSVATESNTLYTDTRFDGAAVTWYAYVRTGWLNFGSQQSLTRVRRIVCLLDSMLSVAGSLHQTTLNLYRDFNDTLVESSTFTAQYNQGYTIGVPIQFRTRTATQKMQSLSIEVRIGMDSSATATMGAKLSGMTIEIAQRGGAARLPQTKTANV